jgi:hypothetical protein
MTEPDFWPHLEFRLCREFAGLPDNHLRFLWCDGFIPEQYLLDDPSPRITGLAWICRGANQEQWSFTLLLNRPYGSRSESDWRRDRALASAVGVTLLRSLHRSSLRGDNIKPPLAIRHRRVRAELREKLDVLERLYECGLVRVHGIGPRIEELWG